MTHLSLTLLYDLRVSNEAHYCIGPVYDTFLNSGTYREHVSLWWWYTTGSSCATVPWNSD